MKQFHLNSASICTANMALLCVSPPISISTLWYQIQYWFGPGQEHRDNGHGAQMMRGGVTRHWGYRCVIARTETLFCLCSPALNQTYMSQRAHWGVRTEEQGWCHVDVSSEQINSSTTKRFDEDIIIRSQYFIFYLIHSLSFWAALSPFIYLIFWEFESILIWSHNSRYSCAQDIMSEH